MGTLYDADLEGGALKCIAGVTKTEYEYNILRNPFVDYKGDLPSLHGRYIKSGHSVGGRGPFVPKKGAQCKPICVLTSSRSPIS